MHDFLYYNSFEAHLRSPGYQVKSFLETVPPAHYVLFHYSLDCPRLIEAAAAFPARLPKTAPDVNPLPPG